MNIPRDYEVELARLNRLAVSILAADVAAWTVAVWCLARNEIVGGTAALAVTSVLSSVFIGIFKRAGRVVAEAERAAR